MFSVDVDPLDRDVIATGCGGLDGHPDSSKVKTWSLTRRACTRTLDPSLVDTAGRASSALSCVNAVRICGEVLVSGQYGCVMVWSWL